MQRWERFAEVAREWDYGTIHTHEEIASLIGVEPKTHEYYMTISKARRPLILDGKMIRVIKNEGYRVILPDEYPAESVKMYQRGADRISLSKEILVFSPRERMSPTAVRHGAEIFNKIETMNNFVKMLLAELKRINRAGLTVVRNAIAASE